MDELQKKHTPLAERLRPKTIADVIGQEHLLGESMPLSLMFASKKPHSMILWGPPGVGKTTIARLMADAFDSHWIALSAVFSGVKDIRAAVEAAKMHQQVGQHTILFIDEIHRFNKAQQDALLPFMESGLVTFIGATTENPSFEVNQALLSRAQVYVLKALTDNDLEVLCQKAEASLKSIITVSKSARALLVSMADGDGRRLLNALEQVALSVNPDGTVGVEISDDFVTHLFTQQRRFDKGGDTFYDQISALHKSVRGSDPDAALYWFCRMIDGGADPKYLARRIVRIAWEDICLADPRAMQIANDAASTYERLGSPEGELALAQALIYLSIAAKSNAGYQAYKKASQFVRQDKSRDVPAYLKNAPTKLTKNLGHGAGYRYAHDEPYAYAAGVHYFPEGMENPYWYQPAPRGLEEKIAKKMAFLRTLQTGEPGQEKS